MKKVANYVVIAVFLSIFLTNCEKNNLQIEDNVTHSIEKISTKEALHEITTNLRASKSSNQISVFNQINTEVSAHKTTLEDASVTYSFLLQPKLQHIKSSAIVFDNLFVSINKDNSITTHILRYIPTKKWLNSDRNLSEYSGRVQYLSEKRHVLSSIELTKGAISKNFQKHYSHKSAACALYYKMTVCGGILGDQLVCTHFYELRCTSGSSSEGSSGGSGSSNSGLGNDEDYSNTGNDDSDPGHIFAGSPIIGGCPEGMLMDINGHCTESITVDKIDFDPSFDDYPCQKDIVEYQHTNRSQLAKFIMSAFGGDQNKVNLTYKVEDLPNPPAPPIIYVDGGTTPGVMKPDGSLELSISLDKQAAEQGSDLLIATIIIHENTHALLTYMEGIVNFNINSTNPTLSELAKAYAKWKGNPNNPQQTTVDTEHFYMKELVGKMADALQTYGESKGYNIERSYYEALCWTSDMRKHAKESLHSEIDDAYDNERILTDNVDPNGNPTYSKGKKCPK